MSNSGSDIYSVGEIRDIKKEIKTLHEICRELSKRVATIENLNIQHQITSLNESLLETQRFLARFGIHYTVINLLHNVEQQKPEIKSKIYHQLLVDATDSRSQAKASLEPLSVYKEFNNKCHEDQKKWGIDLIDLP